MKNILYILLISFISLTIIISCAKTDDSSSSSSSSETTTTATSNACPAENWWQLMEGSTSRNVSLFVTPTLSRHAEQSGAMFFRLKIAFNAVDFPALDRPTNAISLPESSGNCDTWLALLINFMFSKFKITACIV